MGNNVTLNEEKSPFIARPNALLNLCEMVSISEPHAEISTAGVIMALSIVRAEGS